VARRAGNQRLALDAAGGLGAFRKRVDFADDDDLRLAAPPMREDVGRHAGGAGFDRKADRFEHALDELCALELLHAEFAEIIDGVADGGDLSGIALDRIIGGRLGAVGFGHGRRHQRRECEYGGRSEK
jgi:hypothetical protein